ncbi:MAG: hypothetical protein HQK91_01595 [Nitrospirae bacterium]|nr:hypothetical protein [Nitrospirota bacterium]
MDTLLYVNDFIFSRIKFEQEGLIYCLGINLTKFLPITAGKHGLASNPALKGLQITNHKVRALVISSGAVPKTGKGMDCTGIAPTADTWYSELIIIENAPEGFAQELFEFSIVSLVKRVVKMCIFSIDMPDKLMPKEELEAMLEDIMKKHGRTEEQLKLGRNFVAE